MCCILGACGLHAANESLLCCLTDRSDGIQSARGRSCLIVAGCFARVKLPTAGSVSLSDWLAGTQDNFGRPLGVR